MKRLLIVLLVLTLALVLGACGGGPAGGPASSSNSNDTGDSGDSTDAGPQLAAQLSVYNWDDYIDEDVLAAYEEEFGVEIIYDTYASNEDLLAKLQAGATGYDVIFPSDYMVAQMLELGLLAEINTSDLSNWSNINPAFHNPPFDPNNGHCIPYQWGTTGIAYRAGDPFFDENTPDSWAYLFDPALLEQYAGRGINALNDQRELMGAALAYLGYSVNETDRARLEEARDIILQAKPYWKTFNSEDYDDSLLIPDEVVLSHSWSGDAANAYWNTYDEATEDGNWYYAIPKEGGVRWVDNVCIPFSSERYATALHFLNYMLDPEVSAAITNFTYYASPNDAARAFIEADILDDPGIYPPQELFDKLEWLRDVGDAIFIYDEMWTAIKG